MISGKNGIFRVTREVNKNRIVIAQEGCFLDALRKDAKWSGMSNKNRLIWLKQRNKEAANA